ncbi:DEAD/DEAH box helicase [Cohnella abietis]
MGIVTPTPVQEETIPIVTAGHDVISQAQTGTGKTLAFVLPMLDKIRTDVSQVQGLIVTPTRELAIQITAEIKKLLTREDGIRVLAVYGGQDVEAQLHKLQGSMHIIIATPGRLLDHLGRGTISLAGVKMLVLDEADQMLHMGFLKEVEEILRHTPYKKQAMLFSATMPASIREMAGRILRSPQHVTVKSERVTVKAIRQWAVETSDREKQATLVKLLEETQPYLSIIFVRTKRRAAVLNEALQEMGYSSDELHGDLSQAKREQVMKRFRDARLQLLIATDIAARGLDVEGVTHVFNYDIPMDVESYIHRIGRTGRAGEKGLAITLVAPKDRRELGDIEDGIQMAMERRSEEGRPLGGGGLEGPRNSGGLGRNGTGGQSSRRSSAGQAKGRSISGSKARSGEKSYGAGSRGGDKRRGAPVAKPGAGNRSSTGEWVDRGQSRDAVNAGRPGRSVATESASDEATGFTFHDRGSDGNRGGAGSGRKAPAAGGRGGFGRSSGASGSGRSGGFGSERKSSDARGGFGRSSGAGAGFGRSDDRGASRPSAGGGSSRRNSAERASERAAERAAEFASNERKGEGRGGYGGRSSTSGGAGAGRKPEQRSGGSSFGGGRSSGPKSGGFGGSSGGFKGSKGPSGGGGRGGRGSSRSR